MAEDFKLPFDPSILMEYINSNAMMIAIILLVTIVNPGWICKTEAFDRSGGNRHHCRLPGCAGDSDGLSPVDKDQRLTQVSLPSTDDGMKAFHIWSEKG